MTVVTSVFLMGPSRSPAAVSQCVQSDMWTHYILVEFGSVLQRWQKRAVWMVGVVVTFFFFFKSPRDPNTVRARPARAAVYLIAAREPDNEMETASVERQGHPRYLSRRAAVWNLAQLVKHRNTEPEIPGCNPKWADLAPPFLSGMLAGLLLKAPSLSRITCLFEYYLQKHILYAGCFNPPTNLLSS